MKRTVPFTKTITFRTMIAEITDIEVKHSLELTDENTIEGDILVDGKYKMTDASQIEEEFSYKLPFMIEVDSKYDTSNLELAISDFYFEIINEEDLKINVEIEMNGLEERKVEEDELMADVRNSSIIEVPTEVEEKIEKLEINEEPLKQLENEIEEDMNDYLEKEEKQLIEKTQETNVNSIFSKFSSDEETFSTYYVYIVRENDTLDSIMTKYKTNKEEMENYNDLNDIKVGSKLIIPCSNE